MLGRDRIVRWLCSDRVVDPRGRVLSWHNPAHPGYPYPEAAGLWLSWAAWRRETEQTGPALDQVEAVAGRLRDELDARGAVGRGDRLYLFDTCVAVDGLARCSASHGVRPCEPRSVLPALTQFLDRESPVWPLRNGDDHWSSRWGAHHLRSAGLLGRAASTLGDADLADRAWEIAPLARRTPPELESPAYSHALAYALEGDLLLARQHPSDRGPDVVSQAERLEALQAEDGYLPAWSDGGGGARADATAQAVRLWALIGQGRFAASLRRAQDYLARQQGDEGGISYDDGRGDHNTWATMFADQAIGWATGVAGEPVVEALI